MLSALPFDASPQQRKTQYESLMERLAALLEGESDAVALYATVACELHHSFEAFHWTGFYRVTAPRLLTVGPYQGGHGCLRIPFDRGVCGAAARTGETQRVDDVRLLPHHIACSATTRSELVVPVRNFHGDIVSVLDIDSDYENYFLDEDQACVEALCEMLTVKFLHVSLKG